MQTIHQQASQSLEEARQAIGHYCDQKTKQERDVKISDMIMLNTKNIRTKRPTKKLVPKLYGHFEILEQWGELAYLVELSE